MAVIEMTVAGQMLHYSCGDKLLFHPQALISPVKRNMQVLYMDLYVP